MLLKNLTISDRFGKKIGAIREMEIDTGSALNHAGSVGHTGLKGYAGELHGVNGEAITVFAEIE